MTSRAQHVHLYSIPPVPETEIIPTSYFVLKIAPTFWATINTTHTLYFLQSGQGTGPLLMKIERSLSALVNEQKRKDARTVRVVLN